MGRGNEGTKKGMSKERKKERKKRKERKLFGWLFFLAPEAQGNLCQNTMGTQAKDQRHQ